ncbi:hypothetical protein HMSSN139_39300 [Paenibacillus sp. HMSSN-139]|nr:hypothetical protein HMSSN139_39300 [Paenibacillus sp. HMSSN-139]
MERKAFQLGDIVQMKKNHPCGSNEMEIIRMGMDIRIKCVGCKHSVLVPRAKFEKTCVKCSVRLLPHRKKRDRTDR